MSKLAPAALTVALFTSAPAVLAAPAYYDLGGGNTVSGLSADGSVAVASNGDGYALWTAATGLTPIGGSPPSDGGGQAKLSNDGLFVGGTHLNAVTGNTEVARYDVAAGTWTNFGGIGGASGGLVSSGWHISGPGQSVVGLGFVNAGTGHAVQYTNSGGLVDLGSTVAGASSRANAVSDDGTIVAGWQDADNGARQGAVWVNGVQSLILDGDGNTVGEAGDISADGTYVVGSSNFTGYRWSAAGGFETVGPVGDFFNQAAAVAVSADGSTVVGYQRPFGPPIFGRGFYWTEDGGTVDLTDLATSLGLDLGGRILALPLEVSADGLTVAGLDSNFNGFVVTVPEPATLGLASVAGVTLLRRRRRT